MINLQLISATISPMPRKCTETLAALQTLAKRISRAKVTSTTSQKHSRPGQAMIKLYCTRLSQTSPSRNRSRYIFALPGPTLTHTCHLSDLTHTYTYASPYPPAHYAHVKRMRSAATQCQCSARSPRAYIIYCAYNARESCDSDSESEILRATAYTV